MAKTAGEIIREARAESKRTGQSEMSLIRSKSEAEVQRQSSSKSSGGSSRQPAPSVAPQESPQTSTQPTLRNTVFDKGNPFGLSNNKSNVVYVPSTKEEYLSSSSGVKSNLRIIDTAKDYKGNTKGQTISRVPFTSPKIVSESTASSFYKASELTGVFKDRSNMSQNEISQDIALSMSGGTVLKTGGKVLIVAGKEAAEQAAKSTVVNRFKNFFMKETGKVIAKEAAEKAIPKTVQAIAKQTAKEVPTSGGLLSTAVSTARTGVKYVQTAAGEKAGAGAKQLIEKIAPSSPKAASVVGRATSFTVRQGVGLGVTTAAAVGTTKGIKTINVARLDKSVVNREFKYTDKEQKEQKVTFSDLVAYQTSKETEAIGSKSRVKGFIAENLPMGTLIFGSKETYKKSGQEYLSSLGVSKEEQKKILESSEKRRTQQQYEFLAGTLVAGVGAELQGTSNVARASLKQSSGFWKTALKTGSLIAPAGVTEAVAGKASYSTATGQKVGAKGYLYAGLVGAGTAGALGGIIPAGMISSKRSLRFTGRVTNAAANIMDITEKPTDILAHGMTTKKGRTILPGVDTAVSKLGLKPRTPTASLDVTGEMPSVWQDIKSYKESVKKSNTQPQGKSKVTLPSLETKTQTPSDIQRGKTTKTKTDEFIRTPIPPKTNVPIPELTPSITPVSVPVNPEVPVGVMSNVAINVPIPVVSTDVKLPPPLPLIFPAMGGAGGFQIRKGKKYVNELMVGKSLLSSVGMKKTSKPRMTKAEKKIEKKRQKLANRKVDIYSSMMFSRTVRGRK